MGVEMRIARQRALTHRSFHCFFLSLVKRRNEDNPVKGMKMRSGSIENSIRKRAVYCTDFLYARVKKEMVTKIAI